LLTGRSEEGGFELSIDCGRLIGWLETVFMTLGRSCPDTIAEDPAKTTLNKNDRYETFLKSIKTCTPVLAFGMTERAKPR
jgi:hypothetical protein